ncbi:MAG: Vi polysaccharide biosynthesis UDP-N-acetylglucosamine C-6 dehydrogenase TviB, partial [Bacteroidota bacterium]
VENLYEIKLTTDLQSYDGIIVSVGHHEFFQLDYTALKKEDSSIIFDLKGILPRENVNARL